MSNNFTLIEFEWYKCLSIPIVFREWMWITGRYKFYPFKIDNSSFSSDQNDLTLLNRFHRLNHLHIMTMNRVEFPDQVRNRSPTTRFYPFKIDNLSFSLDKNNFTSLNRFSSFKSFTCHDFEWNRVSVPSHVQSINDRQSKIVQLWNHSS